MDLTIPLAATICGIGLSIFANIKLELGMSIREVIDVGLMWAAGMMASYLIGVLQWAGRW